MMETEKTSVPAKAMFSGLMSGFVQISITYPIKFIKTQMQLEEKFGKDRKYKGMLDCTLQTVNSHGVIGLYRGLNVFFYGLRSAVNFSIYETLKINFTDSSGVPSPTNRFLFGFVAGGCEAALINTPLETVECKLIHDRRLGRSRFTGFLQGARLTIKEEGFMSLYSGLTPSVLKQSINQGTRFFIVETLKSVYQDGDPTVQVPKLFVGAFGLIAGFCSVFITNPFDVVKTRMQSLNYAMYKNTVHCFYITWKEEGLYSFYRGLSPRLTRVCLEVSLTFMVYDIVKDMVKNY